MPLYILLQNTLLGFDLIWLLKILVTLFSAVLFIQSGFDKVFDWKGNSGYINSLFEKTILKPILPLLLPTVTVLEVTAGLCSAAGAVLLLTGGSQTPAMAGLFVGLVVILKLFAGLRIAKEYAGAAAITAYFLFFCFALMLFAL